MSYALAPGAGHRRLDERSSATAQLAQRFRGLPEDVTHRQVLTVFKRAAPFHAASRRRKATRCAGRSDSHDCSAASSLSLAACFSKTGVGGTDKTDERGVLSVSAVAFWRSCEKCAFAFSSHEIISRPSLSG